MAKRSSARTKSRQTQRVRRRARPSRSRKKKIKSWPIIFWLVFVIFIFGLIIINRDAISRGIEIIRREMAGTEEPAPEEPPVTTAPPPGQTTPSQQAPATTSPPPGQTTPVQQAPATAAPAPPAPSQETAPPQPPAAQQHGLYFIQVDSWGNIQHVMVNRNITSSDTPMTDTLRALIGGPTLNEINRGLMSLIPPASRIISSQIRGNTAYINFSEEFLYNTFGAEGYRGQVRQVVFTATEFPNVWDVQILINGQQIDFLGEGIWIGSPLNRNMF